MTQPEELARRLLKVEQQLKAYQKLHAEEFEELWQTLNDCKQAIADGVSSPETPCSEDECRIKPESHLVESIRGVDDSALLEEQGG